MEFLPAVSILLSSTFRLCDKNRLVFINIPAFGKFQKVKCFAIIDIPASFVNSCLVLTTGRRRLGCLKPLMASRGEGCQKMRMVAA